MTVWFDSHLARTVFFASSAFNCAGHCVAHGSGTSRAMLRLSRRRAFALTDSAVTDASSFWSAAMALWWVKGQMAWPTKEEIMNADEAKKLSEKAYSELADALAAGKSEALTQFLDAVAHFHSYSFGNMLLILRQRPEATRVAGFGTWKKLGRFVKRGEKGIAIIAPMVYRKDDSLAQADDRVIRGFKVAHVFDVSQTEGDALPRIGTIDGDPGSYTEALKRLVAARSIKLEYVPSMGSALGCSAGGTITLVTGLEPAKEFSVLVHEFAHEILHHARNRPDSIKVRETEAEAVAFVVCRSVGLDTGSAAADYIQLYDGSKDTLAQSLDRIQKTASEILSGLDSDHGHHEALAA